MAKAPLSAPEVRRRTPRSAGEVINHIDKQANLEKDQKYRRSFRLNKVLGRIVPVILLTYVYYAYKLVVICYGYHFLYRQHKVHLRLLAWMSVLHLLFFAALRAYLTVFFAHTANSAAHRPQTLCGWLQSKLGAEYYDPSRSEVGTCTQSSGFAGSVEMCDRNGLPVACWRDQCNGRIKRFRTRHCGDCGTCRIGFDHHCAWFDNDVTAPATLRPFLLFLGCVPPLIGLALGPLGPGIWQTAKRIGSFAAQDEELRNMWWDRWYSWIGGPVFRWMVGWCIGAQRWSQSAPRTDILPHHIVSGPLVFMFGMVFILIASSLACSTLLNVSKGLLTIDIERSKAFLKLVKRRRKMLADTVEGRRLPNDASLRELDVKMQLLEPISYFSIRRMRTSMVVPVSIQDGLFSRGQAKDNLRYFLWDSKAREQMETDWTLSEQVINQITTTLTQTEHAEVKDAFI